LKTPFDVVASFLDKRGWKQVTELRGGSLKLLENPVHPGRQLVLPAENSVAGYEVALQIVLEKIAAMERRDVASIERELDAADTHKSPEGSDTLALRIVDSQSSVDTIPLTLATRALVEVENLIAIGARQSTGAAPYYKRIDNDISNALRGRAVFNHTKRGSFILTVSSPVFGPKEQLQIDESSTFSTESRRALYSVARSLHAVTKAINENKTTQFAEQTALLSAPVVSSNFCEAMAEISRCLESTEATIDFLWSGLAPVPLDILNREPVRISRAMAEDFSYIAAVLRPKDEILDSAFVATVESLSGDVGADGQRQGRVELAVLLPSGETVRASAELSKDWYLIADQAHIAGKGYIRIEGRLEPRPRVWVFTSIRQFGIN
jgi:hypothetical protein